MRTIGATTAVKNLLNGGADFVMADLYTMTLSGGAVLRYTSADVDLSFGGNTWKRGPTFTRGKITHKVGVEVATLQCVIEGSAADQVSGVGFIPFVLGNGLDGARFELQRAFLASWAAPTTVVGTLIDFLGRVTSIGNIGDQHMELTASSDMVLMNVQMPPDLFQASCLNTVYDANCALTKSAFQVSGTVAAGATTTAFNTNLTNPDGYFSQGQIIFTSGANNGLSRGIKSYLSASGALALILPLPSAPGNGDTFHVYPGCDLTLATCQAKFANRIHFRGQPFVPPVTTAV